MSVPRFHGSRPDSWSTPRPYSDASLRLMKHGPIQPMDHEGGLLWHLFRKH